MVSTVGIGDLVAWQGGVLLIGKATRIIPLHAHQAIQVVFGYADPVKLRTSEAGKWKPYRLGIVPSRMPHSMDATASTYNAIIFVEPESAEGRALIERHLQRGLASVDDPEAASAAAGLFATWLSRVPKDRLIDGAARVIAALAKDVTPVTTTDERILRAIEYIRANLTGSLTLDAVAKHAFLSPSRFRHLFVEQTGMGLRPYILWRRFVLAWDILTRGESVSAAAHAAGFSDAAHFTRTSTQMFGFPPSLMRVDAGAEAMGSGKT